MAPSKTAEQLAEQDVAARRSEYLFRMPSCVARPMVSLLNDPRDEPVLYLLCNLALLVLPAVLALYAAPASHMAGLAYFATTYALFLQRYMLTLHVTEHRALFKPGERGSSHARAANGACEALAPRPTLISACHTQVTRC